MISSPTGDRAQCRRYVRSLDRVQVDRRRYRSEWSVPAAGWSWQRPVSAGRAFG